jgi:hypothetical protein
MLLADNFFLSERLSSMSQRVARLFMLKLFLNRDKWPSTVCCRNFHTNQGKSSIVCKHAPSQLVIKRRIIAIFTSILGRKKCVNISVLGNDSSTDFLVSKGACCLGLPTKNRLIKWAARPLSMGVQGVRHGPLTLPGTIYANARKMSAKIRASQDTEIDKLCVGKIEMFQERREMDQTLRAEFLVTVKMLKK